MTQEEKQLLLKDLCARLPHGVKVTNGLQTVTLRVRIDTAPATLAQFMHSEGLVYYLRPMSSMTEEEFKEYHNMLIDVDNSGLMNQGLITKIVDWLDKKMFDHRNLIPKGLALEAKEGMYEL